MTPEQAAKIARWLELEMYCGEVVVSACSDNIVTRELESWLHSDSGVVVMILQLAAETDLGIFAEHQGAGYAQGVTIRKLGQEATQIFDAPTLPDALIAAVLGVIEK